MYSICEVCPIRELVKSDRLRYEEGVKNGLLLNVSQGLSARIANAVQGTTAGIVKERIDQIRQLEVSSWKRSGGVEEATYLNANPELAKAVHDCEVKIQLGGCAIHSTQSVSKERNQNNGEDF